MTGTNAPGPAGTPTTWGLAAVRLETALLVTAVVVRLPMVNRPVAVQVPVKLVIKDTNSASRLWLARRMAQMIAGALPGRAIHVVADAAYAGKELEKLPAGITWTTRLRKDAALCEPARNRIAVPGRGRVLPQGIWPCRPSERCAA
jgi:hypothetical protein